MPIGLFAYLSCAVSVVRLSAFCVSLTLIVLFPVVQRFCILCLSNLSCAFSVVRLSAFCAFLNSIMHGQKSNDVKSRNEVKQPAFSSIVRLLSIIYEL